MRVVGRGHAAVRSTHDKTLELIAGRNLTERGTCVVAVGASFGTARVAGPIRITLRAGGHSFALEADANPEWDPADPSGSAVIRRGPLRLPGTLATNATASAADLPRPLVAALQDPACTVEVTIDARPAPTAAVLFAADPHLAADPRLVAEREVADIVVAQDEPARRLLGRGAHASSTLEVVIGRVLVVATRELPGTNVSLAGVPVETVGLAPQLAAAAAAPWRGPLAFGSGRDADALLRQVPAAFRLVIDTDRDHLAELLATAARVRGSAQAVVVQDFGMPRLLRAADAAAAAFPGAERLYCCFGPGPAGGPEPAARQATERLLADGVSTRTAAKALAALTGWPNRRAYDAVLGMHGARAEDDASDVDPPADPG